MNYYSNKVVYIVGGSCGIGLEIAKKIVQHGGHVHIFARRALVLDKALIEINQAKKDQTQKCAINLLDVIDEESIKKAFDAALSETGLADIIINCAGAASPNYYENIDANEFNKTIQRNLVGVRNVSVAAITQLKKQGGHLVNTSSIAGFVGIFGYTDYCASKFAIIGYCEALQMEVKHHNICISVLCPPDTKTPGFEQEEIKKPWQTRAISSGTKLRTADYVATEFLRQLPKRKSIICCGLDSKLTLLLKRIAPKLLIKIMELSIEKARKKRK